MSKKMKKVRAGVLAFLLAAAALFATGFSALAEPERAGSFSSYRTADAYRALQVGESYGLAYEEGQTLYALAAERTTPCWIPGGGGASDCGRSTHLLY